MNMKAMLFLVMMVISSSLYATESGGRDIQVKVIGNKRMQVTLTAIDKPMEIKLMDSENRIIYTIEAEKTGSSYVLDLHKLPSGSYMLKSVNSEKAEMVLLNITHSGVDIAKHIVNHFPTVVVKDQLVYVNVFPNAGEVLVSITDQRGRQVCQKEIDSSVSEGNVFNFSSIDRGVYSLSVFVEDFEQTELITVN